MKLCSVAIDLLHTKLNHLATMYDLDPFAGDAPNGIWNGSVIDQYAEVCQRMDSDETNCHGIVEVTQGPRSEITPTPSVRIYSKEPDSIDT